MTQLLINKLNKRLEQGNLRQLHLQQGLIDFASNDHLGLARSVRMSKLIQQELDEYPHHLNKFGSTGSRLLTGNAKYAEDLEEKIAHFHGYETGLLFNCGYMANVGLISVIGDAGSVIFFDNGVHASTRDGIRLSQAKALPFRHNDLEQLENRLKNCCPDLARFICIESIYSTDGSKACLSEICALANKYEAHLIVDEAHAVGMCGPRGRGLVAEQNLTSQVFAQVTTFGKSLGVHGAIVLGNNILRKSLINFAKPFIYTTALPIYALAAIKCSYDLFPQLETERMQVNELIKIFQKIQHRYSQTHIQAIQIKGYENVKSMAVKLAAHGFDVRSLISPTVQRGHEVLRICLHSYNTAEELIMLMHFIDLYRGRLHD